MGQLDGKVALVTGANSGIGRATAVLFAKEGAKVFCVSRRVDANQEVVDQIVEEGGIAASVSADLSVQEECRKAVDACIAEYGRFDVLVNSAGIADKHKPINKCEEDWYDYVVKIDQYGTYWMCKYVLEDMEKRGEGSIVNVSSIGSRGVAGIAYSAAKAAVNGMTKNIACYYADTDIRCNAIAPGPTPTALNTPDKLATFDPFAEVCARHMDQSLPEAQPEDQAQAALFFASDASRAVTAQILFIDHGTTLY